MNTHSKIHTDHAAPRRRAYLLAEQTEIVDADPAFWGGGWAERFAAGFDDPVEESAPADDDDIASTVKRAVAHLPELDRLIIEDYYVFCLSRRVIAGRHDLEEREVDVTRARAERRLRVMLAEFVERKFGLAIRDQDECRLCRSVSRAAIDTLLSRRNPEESWGALRRRLNDCFGLNLKRVQEVMTHCRYHMVLKTPPEKQNTEKEVQYG